MKRIRPKLLPFAFFIMLISTILILPASGSSIIEGTYNETFDYRISDGEVTITDWKHGRDYELSIPAYIEGYPVTKIADHAIDTYGPCILHLPETMVYLGDNSLSYSSLFMVTIPDSVEYIGNGVISGSSLEKKESNWENGLLYINNHLISSKYDISGKVSVKEGTLTMANGVFWGRNSLEEVVLPNSLTRVSTRAFRECQNLKKVTFGSNLKTIDSEAFYNCPSLTNVTLPDTLTNLGPDCFWGCKAITSVTVPKTITSLHGPFVHCESLNTIRLHDGITFISTGAFDGTGYYNNPNNWEDGLLYIDNHLVATSYNLSGDVWVKEGTLTVPPRIFAGQKNIDSVYFPDSIKYFYNNVFSDSNVKHVTLPANLTEMGELIFENCHSLTSVVLPQKLVRIPSNTFFNCSSLTYVDIPESVKIIGNNAFARSGLTSVIIPNNVEVVEDYAYSSCMSLKTLVIGKGLTTCGIGVFSDSYWLESCHYMGTEKAFKEIENLTFKYYYHRLVFSFEPPAFGDADENGKIDADDPIYLLYSVLFGTQDYPTSFEYDLNQDGVIDADDAIYLLYHVLFGNNDYPLPNVD